MTVTALEKKFRALGLRKKAAKKAAKTAMENGKKTS